MNKQLRIFIITLTTVGCFFSFTTSENSYIECSNNECQGQYVGAEFINGSDIAHQFSNKMSAKVGDKLKELFSIGEYSQVDFENIEMVTKGMGSGNVFFLFKNSFYTC